MLIFMASLGRELRSLRTLLSNGTTFMLDQAEVSQGTVGSQEVALVKTGMGKALSQRGAHAILRFCRPDAVFSVGYAGALVPEAKMGDVVIGTSVSFLENSRVPASPASHPTLRLLPDSALLGGCVRALDGVPINVLRGPLLTLPTVAGAPFKRVAHGRTAALAVDMESYWIGEVMSRSRVPFMIVRAISDGMNDRIPGYEAFLNEAGDPKLLAVIRYYLAHPHRIAGGFRLWAGSARASRNLGVFAAVYLAMNPEGAKTRELAKDGPLA